jgi:hypothetical protein
MASFGRPDTSLIRIAVGGPAGLPPLSPSVNPEPNIAASVPAASTPNTPNTDVSTIAARRHFDGRFMRAQHRSARAQSADPRDSRPIPAMPVMHTVQEPDPVPAARVPRHSVMTADERHLLRQHIEEAVRDLYKR